MDFNNMGYWMVFGPTFGSLLIVMLVLSVIGIAQILDWVL